MTKVRINFVSKLHLVCGKDELRPVMSHVYFKDGYAYATDAHIIIKQKLDISFNDQDTIDNLDGKFIHRDVFKELYGYEIIKAEKDHIMAHKGSIKCKFYYAKEDGYIFPNIEAVLPQGEGVDINEIAINYKLLNTLSSAMSQVSDGINMRFYGKTKAIKVLSNSGEYSESDQLGILMPLMIND